MDERIKAIRKNLGLTQKEFAARIGSVQNTITGYETGRRIPSSQVVVLICREFNVSETWLRTGGGDMFIALTRDQEITEFVGRLLQGEDDTFKRRFIAMLSKLDESEWAHLESKAKELVADGSKQ